MQNERESDLLKTADITDISAIDRESFVAHSMMEESQKSQGISLKDFEEKMESLKKENFNLKLRVYFLEEKNPNVPEGAENLYKQNIDLKIENESLLKDLHEKQELLCQASRAFELLENAKRAAEDHSEKIVDDLKSKIELMSEEINSLQSALCDASKSNVANDTGYADFAGAVEARDIELNRKLMELYKESQNFQSELAEANKKIEVLQAAKKQMNIKISALEYDNEELKDKLGNSEAKAKENIANLESDLQAFKEKWADVQCDYNEAAAKLKECESERDNLAKLVKKSLETLENENKKVKSLQAIVDQQKAEMKNNEEHTKAVQELERVKSVLTERDHEIERLNTIIMGAGRYSIHSEPPRFSFDDLCTNFNELKVQQAKEMARLSYQKIDCIINELDAEATSKAHSQILEMKQQMAILAEKHEYTGSALDRCAELCAFTLDHLHGLAKFLASLLQNKEIRESLGEFQLSSIQSVIDRSMELRNSMNGHETSLPDISGLDFLISAARDSIANIKDIQLCNKSIQHSSDCNQCDSLKVEASTLNKDLIDLKRVNQLLEDEICDLKDTVDKSSAELDKLDREIGTLTQEKEEGEERIIEYEKKVQALHVKNIQLESNCKSSDEIASKLKKRLEELEKDLKVNWITKYEHDVIVKKLQNDIVNEEAQAAAIRMQLMEMRKEIENYSSLKVNDTEELNNKRAAAACSSDDKENNETKTIARRTLEISEDRKLLLMGEEMSQKECELCPKYRAQIKQLQVKLQMAIDKLTKQYREKFLTNRHIQKQLSQTENFIQQASINMENILKEKNSDQK